jgi:hypothetical protein
MIDLRLHQGLADPENGYPEFLPGLDKTTNLHGFICNLLSSKIDKSQYREATKPDTWAHFRGVDVGCTKSLLK